MNAPATLDSTTPTSAFRRVPLAEISLSQTHTQQLRRARFKPEVIAELAESMRSIGQAQPIVVRIALTGTKPLELVAGERRYLAAQLLGWQEIDALVRKLTDDEVLELQLVENLQREGLSELEEAEGYDELRKLRNISADAVAELIGKSRSYVFARLKLLNLIPAARDAIQAGTLDASKALLIARLPSEKLQKKAVAEITKPRWNGQVMSYREAFDWLQRNALVSLTTAPFALGDGSLLESAGACTACPHFSAHDPELQAHLVQTDGPDAKACTNTPCYQEKVTIHWREKARAIEAEGHKIVDVKRPNYGPWPPFGYVTWNDECEMDEREGGPRTYAQLRDEQRAKRKAVPVAVYLRDKATGEIAEALPEKDAFTLAKSAGIKVPAHVMNHVMNGAEDDEETPTDPQELAAAQERQRKADERLREKQRIERETHARVATEVYKKFKGPLKLAQLRELLSQQSNDDDGELLAHLTGVEYENFDTDAAIAKLDERQTTAAIALYLTTTYQGFNADQLHALAKPLRIDVVKVKRAVELEAKTKMIKEAVTK